MSKTQEISGKQAFIEGLSRFLTQYKKILIGAGVAVVVILAAVVIVINVREKQKAEASLIVEEAQELYQEWATAEEGDKPALEEVTALTDKIISEYDGTFAAKEALFIRGDLAFQQEEWSDAVRFFDQVTEEFSYDYKTTAALFLGAEASEKAGDYDGSLEKYRRLAAQEEAVLNDVPRARFNIGRILYEKGEKEEARSVFNELIEDEPDNQWSNFARTVLIKMDSME